jgi:hypothetical protein
MKCRISVTFEYANDPPNTIKIPEIEAGGLQTIVRRAVVTAKKAKPQAKWSSVVVLIERFDPS